MDTYRDKLWDRTDILIKQSEDRRSQISDLISALTKRIDAEETYAKAIQNSAKYVEKYIVADSFSSLTYSGYRTSCFNRALQCRLFASSVKEEIVDRLRQLLNTQNSQSKAVEKEIKKNDKELASLKDQILKYKTKFHDQLINYQETLITNETAGFLSSITKDKKSKLASKTADIVKTIQEYRQTHTASVDKYNEFLPKYFEDLDHNLDLFQSHEERRLQLQFDSVMKILVFETSMIKNFQYDINNITQQMEQGRTMKDVQRFVSANSAGRERSRPESCALETTLLRDTVLRLVSKDYIKNIEFCMKSFIELTFRKQDLSQESEQPPKKLLEYQQRVVQEWRTMSHMMDICWRGGEVTPDLIATFKALIENPINLLFILLCFEWYQTSHQLELPEGGYALTCKMIHTVLNKCWQTKNVFVARKIINQSFLYFMRSNNLPCNSASQDKQKESSSGGLVSEKVFLYQNLLTIPWLQYRDFWDASILQGVQEDLYLASLKNQQLTEAAIIKERALILGQLALNSHQMIMLGIPVKQVRLTIGRYCRLYDLPEEEDRDLSRTIAAALKKYKQKQQKVQTQQQQQDQQEVVTQEDKKQ